MVEEDGVILGEYTYNGLGQRIIKEADGVTTVFHYDFNGNIIAESDLDGTFTKEYLYRGKSRSAMVDVSSGEIYYFGNDRLGTPQIMTDSTNTVVWEGIYKPFGEADVNPNSSVVNNFRLPGQYFDSETGLHYNYHRYYDPTIGRYLRADPIGLLGGINLFVYCLNNPVNWVDPWGTDMMDSYRQLHGYRINYHPRSNLTPGQERALIKTAGGAAAIVGGALTGQPEIIAGGIILLADGTALSIAELLGGDTSGIPSDYEIAEDILQGIIDSWPKSEDTVDSPCE